MAFWRIFLSRFNSLIAAFITSIVLAATTLVPRCSAATWTPDPSVPEPQLHQRLYEIGRRYCDANFDPVANMVHQKPRDHMVRDSVYYAYGLLMTGDPADRDRAQAILKHVLEAQDTRPNSAWRGAFKWRAEENWETTKNPDLNSAAFVGSALAAIADLDQKHPMLDPDLRQKVDAAGKLAVEEVIRRNVDPGYTNIALLSTAFAAAGEKLWKVPGARKFAQDKLDTVMKLADDGAFYEYLSPTYTAVDIGSAYAAHQYAFSDDFAAKSQALIDHLWNEIALSYHAPTFQLAGPHGRSYGENMLQYSAGLKYWLYLALGGDYPIPDSEKDHAWDQAGLMGFDTSVGLRPEFNQPIPAWREITVVGPDDGAHPTRHLFQYRQGNFVLGTVAFQDEWKQKRNLVAYWRNPGPPPDNLHVGFCIDESNETLPNGFPYAQISFWSKQVKDAALVALVASKAVPTKADCSLVFDNGATVVDTTTSPIIVKDGTITTYLYPVSSSPAKYETASDTNTMRLNRPWSSADVVGGLHILSYLAVFRPSGEPAPAVSDLVLRSDADGTTSANATVDGTALSVTFNH